jgi:hypothetical protein
MQYTSSGTVSRQVLDQIIYRIIPLRKSEATAEKWCFAFFKKQGDAKQPEEATCALKAISVVAL